MSFLHSLVPSSRACFGIPFRTSSSPWLFPAAEGSAQPSQILSSQCHTSHHEPASLFQCQQQEQQSARYVHLPSHPRLCISSASSPLSSLCWDFKVTVWCTALILPPETMRIFAFSGNIIFFSTMVENGHIYKQRSLEEHLGQQTAQQRHILAYFHSFASWNSSLEP